MDPRSADPELLARLVLECRQFFSRVTEARERLPRRKEAPFLYRQLDDIAQLLERALYTLGRPGEPNKDRRKDGAGFLGRLLGKKRNPRAEALDMLGGLDLQGRAWTIPISEVIGFLSTSGKTGILSVHATEENFLVEMHRGRLVHAMSDRTPEGMRLGEILCREGALALAEILPAVDRAGEEGLPLGAFLLKTGQVTEKDLHDALSVQVQSMFHRLFTAENAIYRFREGARMEQVQDLGLNITQLLLESARFHDEKDFRAEDVIEAVVGTTLEEIEALSQQDLGLEDEFDKEELDDDSEEDARGSDEDLEEDVEEEEDVEVEEEQAEADEDDDEKQVA